MAHTRSPAPIQTPPGAPGRPANPTRYDESLRARCFPYRFRKVGSPYAYLDEIGIQAICEFIVKGHLLIDVAEATDVPFEVLRSWVLHNGYQDAVDEATIHSAEGFLAEGMRGLRHAATDFELRRAREIVRQAQFLAEKKDKATYGKKDDPNAGKAVQYVFNIGAAHIQASPTQDPDEAYRLPQIKPAQLPLPLLQGEAPRVESTRRRAVESGSMELDPKGEAPKQKTMPHMLAHLTAFDPDNPPVSGRQPVKPEHDPNLRLVAPRPARPTAENPDIGPFFEEICVVLNGGGRG